MSDKKTLRRIRADLQRIKKTQGITAYRKAEKNLNRAARQIRKKVMR